MSICGAKLIKYYTYINKRNIFPVTSMGRTGSTYRARLMFLINTCINLFLEEGEVNVKNLAERANLSERLIRDYIDDLTTLGVLVYRGHGKYDVNLEYVESLLNRLDIEPYQLQLTEFFSSTYVQSVLEMKPIASKVRKVLEKANFAYAYAEEFYPLLTNSVPPQDILIGEKIILQKKAKNVLLDKIYLPGSASTREKKDIALYDFTFLTITCICSVSYVGYFEKNMLLHNKSEVIEYPRTETFTGRDPYTADEPFYELVTEYPELLSTGRSIAARYLEKIQHYKADLETLTQWGDELEILFHSGTLLPHGMFVQSRKLVELWNGVYKLFLKVKEVCEKKRVLWVGIVRTPQDNIFTKTLQASLLPELKDSGDYYLFYNLLRDRDLSCLVKRPKEKGRPYVENLYEFYLKRDPHVVRIDFLSLDDPVAEQEKIANYAYTLFVPEKKGSICGPSNVVSAYDMSKNSVGSLLNIVDSSLRAGYKEYLSRIGLRAQKTKKNKTE